MILGILISSYMKTWWSFALIWSISFQAGIGEINVKNTDSTMVYVPDLKVEGDSIWKKAEEMELDINDMISYDIIS